jgi:hypothetical protein
MMVLQYARFAYILDLKHLQETRRFWMLLLSSAGSPALDDRFHETGLDETRLDGTGIMLVDSSFEKS